MCGELAGPRADALIAELAGAGHAVFERPQLYERGVSKRQIDHRIARCRLHVVHRGVLSVVPPHTLTQKGRWMAAVLACGEGAALSHIDAGALLDLRRAGSGRIHVTVPGEGGTRRRDGIWVHRSSTFTADQRTTEAGIPVTTAARTIVDLAGRGDRREVERLLDQAEYLRLFDLPQLERAATAAGTRGAALVRGVLRTYAVLMALTESELEEQFLRLCDAHGIPRPETQVWIGEDRVDFLWRAQRLVVETDGRRWHAGIHAWDRDARRDVRLQRRGLRVVRVSYVRVVEEPKALAEDLYALLGLSAAPSAARRPA